MKKKIKIVYEAKTFGVEIN